MIYSAHSSFVNSEDPRMDDVSASPAIPSFMSWIICSMFASEYMVGTEALKPILVSNFCRRSFRLAYASFNPCTFFTSSKRRGKVGTVYRPLMSSCFLGFFRTSPSAQAACTAA